MLYFKYLLPILFIFLQSTIVAANVKIEYKIGKDIITNLDIIDEKKYLIFLRPSLKNLQEDEILKISKNSLIKDIIKKREIDRVFKDFENPKFISELKKRLFNFKKVKNESEFIEIINKNNIDYEKVIEKIKYEGLWNDLIYNKYGSLIKINEDKLENELKVKFLSNKKYEYNLSELIFEIEGSNKLKDRYEEILKFINENDFRLAASKYSISGNANIGGEIGWIKETMLSKKLLEIFRDMETGVITDPIKHPNGYLILRINDRRELKEEMDISKELNELINFEKNRQLNQFSLLYYKKLKQNTIINEY